MRKKIKLPEKAIGVGEHPQISKKKHLSIDRDTMLLYVAIISCVATVLTLLLSVVKP